MQIRHHSYRATCENIGDNDIMLLREFVNSLSGGAFDGYFGILDDSFKTFTQMESPSRKRLVAQ